MQDEPPGGPTAADLPPDLAAWLEERAAENGLDQAELLTRILAAYRVAENSDTVEEIPSLQEVADVEQSVEELRTDLDEKITDIRERVIQVKREADAKAPQDHDHEELASRLSALADRVDTIAEETGADEELRADLTDLSDQLENLESRTESGFEDYESILEDLGDRADVIETRLETVGRAANRLQDAVKDIRAHTQRKHQLDSLKREANRKDVESATCQDCDEVIDISLLTEPACPVCGETFAAVRKRARFWQSHTLVTGNPPGAKEASKQQVDLEENVLPDRNPGEY